MNRSKLRDAAITAVILIFVIGAIIAQRTKPPVGEIQIGVIVSKSGPAGYIGEPEARVLEALIKQPVYLNGVDGVGKIKLLIVDSGGKPDMAQQIFDQFIANSNVVAVIGPSTSGEAITLEPVLNFLGK